MGIILMHLTYQNSSSLTRTKILDCLVNILICVFEKKNWTAYIINQQNKLFNNVSSHNQT